MTISATLQRDYGRLSQGREGNQSFEYTYLIRQDTGAAITSDDILDANVLPKFNTRITGTSAYMIARELWPEEENRSIWYARLQFETITQEVEQSEDPVDFPAHVTYGSFARERVVTFAYKLDGSDTRDNPTVYVGNTVEDPPDPPVVETEDFLTINLEKNYSDFDPNNIPTYKNTVNKDEITIAGIQLGAREGWMMDMGHEVLYDQDGDAYDRVVYSIAVNRDTWVRKIVNAGFEFYSTAGDADSKRPIKISDINTSITAGSKNDGRVAEPQLLAANGTLTDADNIHKLSFLTKFETSWRPLDLPTRKDGTS